MVTGNSVFNTLGTTTLSHFANEIFDNVITNNAALNQLKKAGNIKIVSGGKEFTHPVYYKKNNTFGAISKLGTIPTDLQDPVTRALYDVKVLAGSVVYSIVEEAMNAGDKEKLIDYVETLKMDAETSMAELMGDQVFKAESAIGDNDFDSIPYLVSSAPSARTANHVGDIDTSAAGNAYWKNYTYATTVSGFATSSEGINAMDTVVNNCTFGRQGPTFILTTKAIYTLYNAALTPQVRYTQLESGDGGFKNLMYATLPMFFDDNAPTARMYFIDGNSLKLQVLLQGNMKITQFQESYNQLVARSILYMLANLTTGSRRTNGVITSITG